MKHVLKANRVQFQGPFQLSIDPAAARTGHDRRPGSSPARIRVAEMHEEFAVIEVTCACGQTTFIRCDYAAADVAAATKTPAERPGPGPRDPQEIGQTGQST